MPKIIAHFEGYKYQSEQQKQLDLNFIKIQCKLSGKSLLQACKEGQQGVFTYLQFKMGASIFFTQTAYSVLLEKTLAMVCTEQNYKPFLDSILTRCFSRALRQACAANSLYLVTILLDYLQDQFSTCINEKSSNGKTALHWAAISAQQTNGDTQIIELLLRHRADDNIRDNDGKLYNDYFPQILPHTVRLS